MEYIEGIIDMVYFWQVDFSQEIAGVEGVFGEGSGGERCPF